MAKFDEEAWRKRNEREQEEEAARKFLEYQGSDDELVAELSEMLGTEFPKIQRAMQDSLSGDEQDKMLKAADKARKALRRGQAERAEKIIMGNHGLREARKRSKKGCAVVALMMLGSASLSIWGLVEAAGGLLG